MTKTPTPIARGLRMSAAAVLLIASFAIALRLPIPSVADDARADVISQLRSRLPGWHIDRVEPSWEGAYTVVTSCATSRVGFQFVPGHGLPMSDAWLQPANEHSRERLTEVSDHWRYLIWYHDPAMRNTLSCSDEMARARPAANALAERID